jgi:transcriptional regulator with XRE-family HTH domain
VALSEEFGSAIVRAREAHGLSQYDVAQLAGIDRYYLGSLERGKQTKHLQRLGAVLDVLGLEVVVQPKTVSRATGGS